jgi:hypothetical protein
MFQSMARDKMKILNEITISKEHAKSLCQAANLALLIRYDQIEDVMEILKFAQNNSLSFEEIFSYPLELFTHINININININTHTNLMKIVDDRNFAAAMKNIVHERSESLTIKI